MKKTKLGNRIKWSNVAEELRQLYKYTEQEGISSSKTEV